MFSKHSFSQEFYGAEARKIIPAAEILAKDTLLDIPTFIRFAKGSEINFKDILPWLKNNFQISSDFDLKLLRFERDEWDLHITGISRLTKAIPYILIFLLFMQKMNWWNA